MGNHYRRRLCITLIAAYCASAFCAAQVFASSGDGADEDGPMAQKLEESLNQKRDKAPGFALKQRIEDLKPKPILPMEKVLIREVNVVGATLLAKSDITRITLAYYNQNKSLNGKEMQRLADLVSRAYSRNGYITSYAYIAAEKLDQGILEIRVVEGKTGKIVIRGNWHFSTELLRKKITLREGDPFNFKQLNIDIYRMNRSQDRKVSVELNPDSSTGAIDVILTVKDKLPLHVTVQTDNYGAETILYNRYKTFFIHNNLSGHDDTLTAKVEWAQGDSHKIYDLDYQIPLDNTWKFQFYLLPYKSEDYYYKDNEDTDFEKRARKFYFWFYQSLFNEPNLEVISSYGFTYFDIYWYKPYEKYEQTAKRDSFRIMKWDLSFNRSDKYGRWVITNDLQKGIPNMWGGAPRKSDESSMAGAKGDYLKNFLTVARRQKLAAGIDFIGKARWQISSATLTGVNAFSAGGYCGVIDNRGFPRTQSPSDGGSALNLGFQFPAYLFPKDVNIPASKTKWYDSTKFFVFWDWSRGVLKSPKLATKLSDPNDKKITTLRSAGVGMTFAVPDQGLSARVDCGFPLSHQTPADGDHTHTWFSVTKNF